jgi:hypothetical protein
MLPSCLPDLDLKFDAEAQSHGGRALLMSYVLMYLSVLDFVAMWMTACDFEKLRITTDCPRGWS